MKILALGGLWIPYIRDNWFDAISHVLGQDVLVVNAGPLLVDKEKSIGWPEGYHSAYIYELLRREHFDYLFFYHDWIFGSYPDGFFDKVRSAGVRTVAFHPDDEPEHWYARNKEYDHHFDLVASHSREGVARRRADGWGDKVMYLPWGYNHRKCYALPDTPKRYDVAFIGKYKISDTVSHAHVEDGAQRDHVLLHLASACERNGWLFRIFGHGWESHPVLHKYFGGTPSHEEMVRILNETRVVFNPAWSSDGDPNAVQTKLRHFEVPGCGAFQLTNENPELAELFLPGKEVIFYRSNQDLMEIIERFLSDSVAREGIAQAGHARALSEHTLDHRINALFGHAAALYPPQQCKQNSRSQVETIQLRSFHDLTTLHNSLLNNPPPSENADWVHIVGGNFEFIRTDYRILEPFFQKFPEKILTIRTFIDFIGIAANPLQPKAIESEGYILAEEIDVNDINFSPFGRCRSHFLGIWTKKHACLMINYITPRSRLREVLDAFLSGSLEAIHCLGALPTGRIVTEALIALPEGYDSSQSLIRKEYVRRLNILLPRFKTLGWSVVVYGVTGMGEVTLQLIGQTIGLQLVGVIDRSLDIPYYREVPVLQINDLIHVKPDVLILSSGASGPKIHSNIEHLEAIMCILPLYDLGHPVWNVVLP